MKIIDESLKLLKEKAEEVAKFSSLYAVKKTFGSLRGYILGPFIAKKLRNSIFSLSNIYDALNLAFSFQALGVSIKPSQVKREIAKLLEILTKLRPKIVLEIGTYMGGTLFLFTRVADPSAKIISIDLPCGYPKWKVFLFKAFSKGGQKIYLIRRNSHDPQTIEEIRRILGDEKVDFLFIDGDHTYEGVKKDFEMYSSLVRKGGIIAFHDIVPGHPRYGVPKFWNEIKMTYKHLEIVEDWSRSGRGIGVIYV
jgi:predicted O-methyltransferase YrrM